MSRPPEQLTLDLPHRSALGAEDFLVSACNQAAVAVIDRWPDWPRRAMIVGGPGGSGKSHLVNVWRERSGAAEVKARELDETALAAFERQRALAVENIDRGIKDERILFHALNMAAEHGFSILLTTRSSPGELKIALPDLRSRLKALPYVEIAPPDEALLRALLVKLFADRQLAVEPHVISFIALRTERSTDAVRRIVAEIDHLALASHRRVTRALAAEALARFDTVLR